LPRSRFAGNGPRSAEARSTDLPINLYYKKDLYRRKTRPCVGHRVLLTNETFNRVPGIGKGLRDFGRLDAQKRSHAKSADRATKIIRGSLFLLLRARSCNAIYGCFAAWYVDTWYVFSSSLDNVGCPLLTNNADYSLRLYSPIPPRRHKQSALLLIRPYTYREDCSVFIMSVKVMLIKGLLQFNSQYWPFTRSFSPLLAPLRSAATSLIRKHTGASPIWL
jgi:hypothetical protein